jgi:hypothetical protein
MRAKRSIPTLIVASLLAGAAPAQAQPGAEDAGRFLVLSHQSGSLALQVSQISSVWYRAAAPEKPAQIRISSPALGEAKSLAADDADALWRTIHAGLASSFVFVAHMDGTLAIPRAQIRTAYYDESGSEPTLRLQYEGDPSGKTLAGDGATRIWKSLAE